MEETTLFSLINTVWDYIPFTEKDKKKLLHKDIYNKFTNDVYEIIDVDRMGVFLDEFIFDDINFIYYDELLYEYRFSKSKKFIGKLKKKK